MSPDRINTRVSVTGVSSRGPAGRGIADAVIDVDGHLKFTMSDSTTIDAGAVGVAGRGVTSATIENDHLMLTFSDSSTVDAGSVVGPQGPEGAAGTVGPAGDTGPTGGTGATGASGRGITDAVLDANGHLVLTFSDSTTSDLGVLDDSHAAMPQATAPAVFARGDVVGLTWDGLDVDGNPMPVGFDHYLIETRTRTVGSYAQKSSFTPAALPDTSPYVPPGWTMYGGSVMAVSSGALALVNFPTESFSIMGTNAAVAYIDSGQMAQRAYYEWAGGPSPATVAVMFYNLVDPTTTTNPDCIMIQSDTHSGNSVTLTAYRLFADGSFVAWTSPSYPTTDDNELAITLDGLSYTIADSANRSVGSGTINAKGFTEGIGTFFGFALNPSQGLNVEVMRLLAAEVQYGPWESVAWLSGPGTAVTGSVSGQVRGTAVNGVGGSGAPSPTLNVALRPPADVANALTWSISTGLFLAPGQTGTWSSKQLNASSVRIFAIQASSPCRVRLYASGADRANDAGRAYGTAYGPGAGVFLDIQITTLDTWYNLAPVVDYYNMESPPTDNMSFSFTNNDTVSTSIRFSVMYGVLG